MCFQAVPNEASKLIEFQDVVRSTVEFENKLRSMMFLSPDRKDGKLTQFVDDVEVKSGCFPHLIPAVRQTL